MSLFLPPEWHAEVDSTNVLLRRRLAGVRPPPSGFVLAARAQTEGQGRSGRRWVSSPGRDLMFSFLLRRQPAGCSGASLPMAVALGVADALARWQVVARVKWPNDVLVVDRKICGILSEQDMAGDEERLVVGVGVNLNMTAGEAGQIDRPATSVGMETGRELSVDGALAELLECVAGPVVRWQAAGFAGIRDEWLARCAYLSETVEVHGPRGRQTGVLAGFGEEGELLLRGPDGTIRTVWSGDVRGLARAKSGS